MTVVIKDLFGGGDDADIAGRVPDTLSNGGLAHWEYAYRLDGGDTLAIESGRLVPPAGVLDTVVAVVLDHGLVSPEYSVRKTVSVTLPSPGRVFIGPALGVADDGFGGYIALVDAADDVTKYEIYAFSNGSYTLVAPDASPSPTVAGTFVLDLSRRLGVLTLRKDGVVVATGADATYTAIGNPGLELDNTNAGDEPEAFVSLFEVDDTPTVTVSGEPPCASAVASIETFASADDPDITGRTPTSGEGTWLTPGSSVGVIDLVSRTGVTSSAGEAQALLTGLPASPCALGAEVTARFPEHHDAGMPGSDPYIEPFRYKVTNGAGLVYEDGLVSDLGSGTTFVYGATPGSFELADLVLWSNGQPRSWAFEYSGGDPATGAGRLYLRFYTTVHKTAGGSHDYDATVTWTQARDPDLIPNPSPPPSVLFSNYGARFKAGGLSSTPVAIVLGPQNVEPAHPYPPFYYPDGQPATVTVTVSTSAPAPVLSLEMEGEPVSASAGRITVDEWAEMQLDGTTSYDTGTPGSSAGAEQAEVAALVQWDTTVAEGYRLALVFDHTGLSPTREYVLQEVNPIDGVTGMRSTGPLSAAHDTPYRTRLVMAEDTLTGNLTLYAKADGVLLFAFDLVTDVADDTSAAVDLHEDGLAGFSAIDASGAGLFAEVLRVEIIGVPCEGGPEDPYPPNPPPAEPLPGLWMMQGGQWRAIIGPGPNVLSAEVFGTAEGTSRRLTGLWMMQGGVWRPIQTVLEQAPPPDTPRSPHSDPCETLTPDTDLPPVGDVTPIPAAGGRYFGLCFLPPTLMGAVFNGTQRAPGSWTPSEISQCAARGGVLQLGQGGYRQFRSNGGTGFYSPVLMDQFIERMAATIGSAVKAAQLAGTAGPIIFADDFRVQMLWPTSTATGGGTGSGLNDAELTRIAAKWLFEIPGILLGLRLRPTRLSGPIAGVTVYVAQYDSPNQVGKSLGTHVTATDHRNWRDAELDKIESWANGSVANLQPNYSGGGWRATAPVIDMGTYFVGHVMMPDELVECADGWYGDDGGGRSSLIYSSVGYLYTTRPSKIGSTPGPALLELTDYMDGMTYMRNGLMSLTPL